jgi:hypothetical protein
LLPTSAAIVFLIFFFIGVEDIVDALRRLPAPVCLVATFQTFELRLLQKGKEKLLARGALLHTNLE